MIFSQLYHRPRPRPLRTLFALFLILFLSIRLKIDVSLQLESNDKPPQPINDTQFSFFLRLACLVESKVISLCSRQDPFPASWKSLSFPSHTTGRCSTCYWGGPLCRLFSTTMPRLHRVSPSLFSSVLPSSLSTSRSVLIVAMHVSFRSVWKEWTKPEQKSGIRGGKHSQQWKQGRQP